MNVGNESVTRTLIRIWSYRGRPIPIGISREWMWEMRVTRILIRIWSCRGRPIPNGISREWMWEMRVSPESYKCFNQLRRSVFATTETKDRKTTDLWLDIQACDISAQRRGHNAVTWSEISWYWRECNELHLIHIYIKNITLQHCDNSAYSTHLTLLTLTPLLASSVK